MKKTILVIIGILLVLCGRAYSYDDHDFQVWNTDTQELKINKKLKVALEEEFRWGDNANIFYYHHYDLSAMFTVNKYLSVGGGYRHIYELKNGKFKLENDPFMVATIAVEGYGFSLESRNRMEYRHFDYQDDSWRYRNKFTLKFPWKFTRLEIQPYIADEIFVVFGEGIKSDMNQNRLSAGFGVKLTKNIKAELYYMLVSSKSSDIWKDSNVLGTKIKLNF